MKTSAVLAAGLALAPTASAWGSFGHIAVAYLASDFVAPKTQSYFQRLLRNSTDDYLAGVATWADSIRYTKWGKFTEVFHFIDAKDDPPRSCEVDLSRDCKAAGCVVTALANYTSQLLQPRSVPVWQQAQAAKFVVHFVGDVHQPLHDEDVARGGNGIKVWWYGAETNLHHIWDSNIPEKMVGGVRAKPFDEARRWATKLAAAIRSGKFSDEKDGWLKGVDINDPAATALEWARQGNKYICSTVLPDGPDAIRGARLEDDYFKAAAPVVEVQVARAGYRLAAWLNLIVQQVEQSDDEL